MKFLPIVERELRVSARRRATYWSRLGAALLALVVCSYVYLVSRRFAPAPMLGRYLFGALAWVSFLFCWLAGTRLTSDCVSEEKREGTLGLLFLTDLKGYDIALGKLVASSLNSVYGLLALVPILGITLLLGGVTAAQFGQVVLVLLNTMFFSLAVGLLCSTILRNGRRAAGLSFFFLLLVTGGLPIAAAVLAEQGSFTRETQLWVSALSPGYALTYATSRLFGAPFVPGYWTYWVSILAAHVIGWLALVTTSFLLPRVWKDRPATPFGYRWRVGWQRFCHGNLEQRARFRRRLLNVNPFFWLAARDRLKPTYVWTVLALAGLAWLYLFLEYRGDMDEQGVYSFVSICLHGLMKFWVATAVVQRLAEDKRSAALDLILCSPLGTGEILRGQWRALWRQFGGPVIAVLVADVGLCYGSLRASYDEDRVTLLFYALRDAALLADLVTIGWLGMWVAVTARHPNQAAAGTLVRIVMVPWVGLTLLLTAYHLFELRVRWNLEIEERGTLWVWFVLGLLTDAGFTAWAIYRLGADFRTRAADRFRAGKRRLWQAVLGLR